MTEKTLTDSFASIVDVYNSMAKQIEVQHNIIDAYKEKLAAKERENTVLMLERDSARMYVAREGKCS